MTLLASSGGAGIVAVGFILGAYIMPSVIAYARGVPNVASIAVVNVFLGWTFVGWVVALAMAARSMPKPTS